ncbi:cbb3-type cytochrome oxidase subunit 3 [Pseudomonas sp. NPDC087804]|uniref:cbb3-type cytochrome oxidase subunit 3 n=1 Tax=Pseudomonas sp. NPDC087804 TaxID=3364449 RepID=UPI00382355F8
MVFEMSAGLIRGLGTVVVFVAFVGLTLWVFNRKRTPEFAEARLLPFADEPQPEPTPAFATTQAPEPRSTRP